MSILDLLKSCIETDNVDALKELAENDFIRLDFIVSIASLFKRTLFQMVVVGRAIKCIQYLLANEPFANKISSHAFVLASHACGHIQYLDVKSLFTKFPKKDLLREYWRVENWNESGQKTFDYVHAHWGLLNFPQEHSYSKKLESRKRHCYNALLTFSLCVRKQHIFPEELVWEMKRWIWATKIDEEWEIKI